MTAATEAFCASAEPFQILSPDFDAIPIELRSLPRWIVWKKGKVPYSATAFNSTVDATDPYSWATFDQAQVAYEEGGYLGVGFALNGDGLVGIDLDKCVHSGVPEPAALELMERIRCGYVEVSPSGTGLRGFGYVDGDIILGTRGKLDGLSVELYSSKRYLTVTGKALVNQPLGQLQGVAELALEIRGKHLQKGTEDNKGNPQYSSVLPLSSSVGLPVQTIPTEAGQRNRCLFDFARFLRGTMPDASRTQLRELVMKWHASALPAIGTKDFAVTWCDFLNAWDKVHTPYGAILNSVIQKIDHSARLPSGVEELGYQKVGQRLVRICNALQEHHRDNPFFLSSRQAGELLGIHFTDAARMLAAFVADGVLDLVTRGAGRVASRYRFAWSSEQLTHDA